jgi:hypothetical protein
MATPAVDPTKRVNAQFLQQPPIDEARRQAEEKAEGKAEKDKKEASIKNVTKIAGTFMVTEAFACMKNHGKLTKDQFLVGFQPLVRDLLHTSTDCKT